MALANRFAPEHLVVDREALTRRRFVPTYFMHLAIQILLWGFVYTAWALMGRFGFVSLGHGAFLGIGAYVPALLWNYYLKSG